MQLHHVDNKIRLPVALMHTNEAYDTVIAMTNEPLHLVGHTFEFTESKEVLLSFDVGLFYPESTPHEEIDSFECVKFRFNAKPGNRPRQWDYRILSCPDDDHDVYLVKGRFYLELVHKIHS